MLRRKAWSINCLERSESLRREAGRPIFSSEARGLKVRRVHQLPRVKQEAKKKSQVDQVLRAKREDKVDRSHILASRFARGNLWTGLSFSVRASQFMEMNLLYNLSLRSSQFVEMTLLYSFWLHSRKFVAQFHFLASRYARGNWWTGLFW